MQQADSAIDFDRRTVLKTIGVAGTVGALGGIAAADTDEVDREQLILSAVIP
jgi:hypothetical protein